MTAPREILDRRLVEGEIDEVEYKRLCQILSPAADEQTAKGTHQVRSDLPPPLPSSASRTGESSPPPIPPLTPQIAMAHAPKRKSHTGIWVTGAIVGCVLALVLGLGLTSVNGLSIGNIQANGNLVTFKFANNSDSSGDVVFWIEQNGVEKCERVMLSGRFATYDIKIHCPTLTPGKFYVYQQWSDFNDKANVAQRLSTS